MTRFAAALAILAIIALATTACFGGTEPTPPPPPPEVEPLPTPVPTQEPQPLSNPEYDRQLEDLAAQLEHLSSRIDSISTRMAALQPPPVSEAPQEPPDQPQPTKKPISSITQGMTLENPTPSGGTLEASDQTKISVVRIITNANNRIRDYNIYNDAPLKGYRYYMVFVNIDNPTQYTKEVSPDQYSVTGQQGHIYNTVFHNCGTAPDELGGSLLPDQSLQGSICLQVSEEDTGLIMIHTPSPGARSRYLALE